MDSVAIVINYNYGRFLRDCLESIDRQTADRLRVIVIDDASTDESNEVISEWASSTPLEHEIVLKPVNRGPADSYNLALGRLRDSDECVGFIDSDDVWLPDKFEKQRAALRGQGDDCCVVYSEVLTLDDATGATEPRELVPLRSDESALDRLLTRGTFCPLNGTLIRASTLRMITPLDTSFRLCDYQLWLRLARLGTFHHMRGEVAMIRRHGRSMSQTEALVGERLRLLELSAHSARERRLARQRGRVLMKAAVLNDLRLPPRAYVNYAASLRDPAAVPFLAARVIPGASSVIRRAATAVDPAATK